MPEAPCLRKTAVWVRPRVNNWLRDSKLLALSSCVDTALLCPICRGIFCGLSVLRQKKKICKGGFFGNYVFK